MIILKEKGKTFEYYVRALRKQYGNLTALIFDCNKELFNLRRTNSPQFQKITPDKIQVGNFYHICYDYNSNKLYCPIWVIDYRVLESNKHVIYTVNLDYLPFDYKLLYFSNLYNKAESIFNYNDDAKEFTAEKPIPVKFQPIYDSLKNNGGYNFAITAFDLTKIKECYGVSTSLLYVLIHTHMRPVNVKLMKDLMNSYQEDSEQNKKLKKLITNLDDIVETYDNDIKSYYEKLKAFESNYKLFED